MDKLRDKIERTMCAERCAIMGEPPCHSVEGEWPNQSCDCHDITNAIMALPALISTTP